MPVLQQDIKSETQARESGDFYDYEEEPAEEAASDDTLEEEPEEAAEEV